MNEGTNNESKEMIVNDNIEEQGKHDDLDVFDKQNEK